MYIFVTNRKSLVTNCQGEKHKLLNNFIPLKDVYGCEIAGGLMHYFVLIWLALCKQISDGAWDGLVIEIDTFLSLSKIRYLMVVKKLGL